MKNQQAKCRQEWIAEGKHNQKPYMFFQGFCLDLTKFINMHPGGSKVLADYMYKDITDILFNVFPHNQHTTPKLLAHYRIGEVKQALKQKNKMTGTILKHRNPLKQNTIDKKTVQFPSQIKKLASQKQKMEQMKRSVSKNSKNKKSKPKNGINPVDQKSLKKTKNMNPDYVNMLKASKKTDRIAHEDEVWDQNQNEAVKIQDNIDNLIGQYIDGERAESSIVHNLMQSTSNISIKNHLKRSTWGSLPQNIEETIPLIKIPVFNVKMDRVW